MKGKGDGLPRERGEEEGGEEEEEKGDGRLEKLTRNRSSKTAVGIISFRMRGQRVLSSIASYLLFRENMPTALVAGCGALLSL